MTDLEKLKNLTKNKKYLFHEMHTSSDNITEIVLIHSGGCQPPEGQYVSIETSDSECIAYIFTSPERGFD